MGLRLRGISYDATGLPASAVDRELGVIRDDLRCNAVMLNGTDLDAQVGAARRALELGLEVWVQAHRVNASRGDTVAHLRAVAAAAEELRGEHPGRVTLVVGNELSLFSRGIVPGPGVFARLQVILRARRLVARRIARRLDARLAEAAAVARAAFGGPITYCAALWEDVDWSRFDVVGVNLYRLGNDPDAYSRRVRALVERHPGKAVAITEFGCGAFAGADRLGPGGFRIVNWFRSPPRVRSGHPRDEGVQAAYVGELIDTYAATGVDGCFVFTFAMRAFPYDDDPRRDLDRAGFGVVRVAADDPLAWERKAAFAVVARRYGARPPRTD